MIKIKPKNTKIISAPYYLLVYNYMMGDADGDTTETVRVSLENPYTERYVKLLDKLTDISLTPDSIKKVIKKNGITKDDYKFLLELMFGGYGIKIDEYELDENFSSEFSDVVTAEM
jgi:hypothetical protein